MMSLRRDIPSPGCLFTFESVARNKNFRLSAEELNVTQPAVSYQIKQLETFLGCRLFDRSRRGARLTPSGNLLYQAVDAGFRTIQEAIHEVSKSREDNTVTLCVSTALAAYVLLPHLPQFQLENPHIDLNLKVVDRDVDPHAEYAHLTVRLGTGTWAGMESWKLFDEIIYPVCSPGYLEQHGPVTSLEDLAKADLLHLEEPYRERMGWPEWLERRGWSRRPIERHLRFSEHTLVMEAAIRGQGIGLGWWHTADLLIERGLLVRPLEIELRTDQAFCVVASEQDLPLSAPAKKTRDWLLRFSREAQELRLQRPRSTIFDTPL